MTKQKTVKLTVPADVTRNTPIWEVTLPSVYTTYPLRVSVKSQVFTVSVPVFETAEDNRVGATPVGWLYVNATDDQAVLVRKAA